jgi:hypothetical protein
MNCDSLQSRFEGEKIMTTTIKMTTKTKTVAYWLATGVAATAYLAMGTADLLRIPAMTAGLAHLGYPVYLATILGIWKLLGATTITVPGFPRLKEWAYAGMFFNLTGAALSHAATGDPSGEILVPLGLLAFVLISMALRSARGGSVTTRVSAPQAA